MALSSTVYTLGIALSDVDRGVYEQLNLKAACHPSETPEYFLTRILAYCLEYREGIGFSKGLSEPDEPAITVRDLTARLDRRMAMTVSVADRQRGIQVCGPRPTWDAAFTHHVGYWSHY